MGKDRIGKGRTGKSRIDRVERTNRGKYRAAAPPNHEVYQHDPT